MKTQHSIRLLILLMLLTHSRTLFSATGTFISNNDSIYKVKQMHKPSFFNKVFGKLPAKNAVVEINNLLATKSVTDVSSGEISGIAARYKVNLKKFKNELLEMYEVYLNHCLADMTIDESESTGLNHMKSILNLENVDTDRLFDKAALITYKNSFHKMLRDGQIDHSEQETLEKFRSGFHLSNDSVGRFESVAKQSFMKNSLNQVISDKRLSPDELTELDRISKNLNVPIDPDQSKTADIEKYKLYWIVENGDIPVVKVDVSLQKGEKCFFYTKCDFFEVRNVLKSINYSGYQHSVKVGRGCRYVSGSRHLQRIKSKELRLLDSGALYLTNRRLIYLGSNKNVSIRLSNILTLTPYSDGVEISKESGNNPIYKFNADSELLALMVSRLTNE